MSSILVVTREESVFQAIQECFLSGHELQIAPDRDGALTLLQNKRYDFVFIDLELLKDFASTNGYKTALEPFWHLYPSLEIIIMVQQDRIKEGVLAVRAGASAYVTHPLNQEEIRYITESVMESVLLQHELDYLRDQFWRADSLEIVQTKSLVMQAVFDKIRSVAPTKSTVLLMGETGTGKGVMARLIHQHSNRRDSQFISVHCGAIPDTLLESELFGHEKGAFTGAVRRKLGKFEIAHGGTIFLDEIGTLTPSAQIKLLQVLQDGTFQRVGGEATIQVNVRVIAATNIDLKEMCEEGGFRKDLYYRLNVFPIEIPPLRERTEDIPHLVKCFLTELNRYEQKEIHDVHPRVMDAFITYPWPGNIRELENLIERAYIMEGTSELTPMAFPVELFDSETGDSADSERASLTLAQFRRKGVELIERRYIRDLLENRKGRIKESAQIAGITTRQLNKLMAKYGIRKEEFK